MSYNSKTVKKYEIYLKNAAKQISIQIQFSRVAPTVHGEPLQPYRLISSLILIGAFWVKGRKCLNFEVGENLPAFWQILAIFDILEFTPLHSNDFNYIQSTDILP